MKSRMRENCTSGSVRGSRQSLHSRNYVKGVSRLSTRLSKVFAIDKEKFGAFVAQLRKEKRLTQREVAERLYVSDKAVSKWETGASIPDTALLIPLAELLGVTVTELLLCRRQASQQPMDARAVEDVVKTAITYSERNGKRVWRNCGPWPLWYAFSLLLGISELLLSLQREIPIKSAQTAVLLGAIFGAWFCFFARKELPRFYDENRIYGIMDGPFRMNVPGLRFNNRNWPHIITVGRVWSCSVMAVLPVLCMGLWWMWPAAWPQMELAVMLGTTLGGLFVPLYVVGKRFE